MQIISADSTRRKRILHHTLATEENTNMLRNRENYANCIRTGDSKETGIIEHCILHEIKSFDVTQNIAVDIMHDIFEGVGYYNMGNILNYLVNIKQYFNLVRLNVRKQ